MTIKVLVVDDSSFFRRRVSEILNQDPELEVIDTANNGKEAVEKARAHMIPFPPSSPCMALFKDGELVHMLERHHIEGRPAELIAENLMNAYNEHC